MSDSSVNNVLFNNLINLKEKADNSSKNSLAIFQFFKNINRISNNTVNQKPKHSLIVTDEKKQDVINDTKKEAVNIKEALICLHPKGIGNGYVKYKEFSKEEVSVNKKKNVNKKRMLIKKKNVKNKEVNKVLVGGIGYISNFRQTGQEAIQVHGTKDGKVSLFSHNVPDRKTFSVKEFIDYLKDKHIINLKEKSEPLYMMSCFGVSNGVYQAFANELNRKVIGYGNGGAISSSYNLSAHFTEEKSIINSVSGDVENDHKENLTFFKASEHIYTPDLMKK